MSKKNDDFFVEKKPWSEVKDIFVSFNGLEKMVYFPDAFVKGFLKK